MGKRYTDRETEIITEKRQKQQDKHTDRQKQSEKCQDRDDGEK